MQFAVAGPMAKAYQGICDQIRMNLAVGILELKREVKKLEGVVMHQNVDVRKVCSLTE
jgi:hypothetical protein